MLRALVAMTTLLLFMNVAIAAPPPRAASSPADIIIHGPTFRYMLKRDRNPEVCKHMLHVFNDKFTHLWDAPPLTSLTKDPNYSATGRYAFPLLPGVKHSPKATMEMFFSAWPTSPEFSAIHWKEGRWVLGGCPTCSWDHKPLPILVAYFDFDNDGSADTVIKEGGSFFKGYEDMSHVMEYLIVWRGQTLKVTGTPSMWKLENPQDKKLSPIVRWGTYLRPFIYHGVTYVVSYNPDFGTQRPYPSYPVREDMLIERYDFASRKQTIAMRGPDWKNAETICDFQMKRLNFR